MLQTSFVVSASDSVLEPATDALVRMRSQLIQTDAIGLALLSLQGGFDFANEGSARIFGRSTQELIGQPIIDLIHPSDRQSFVSVFSAFAAGQLERKRWDLRLAQNSGLESWVDLDLKLERDSSSGQPSHVFVVLVDISERKRAEGRSALMERRLKALRQSATVGLYFFKIDRSVHEPNEAFLQLCGFSSSDKDCLRLDLDLLTPEEWREQDEQMMAKLFEENESVTFMKEFFHQGQKGGQTVPVCVTLTALDSDDEFDGIAVVHNMTDLFEARLQAEENRAKASLALDAARIGLWEFVPSEQNLIWDSRCRAILGPDSPHVEAVSSFKSRVSKGEFEWIKLEMGKVLESRGESLVPTEFRFHVEGRERVVSAMGRFFNPGFGQPPRVVGTLIDVTEAKLSEQRLHESEERFRTLAEAIPQIVFVMNADGQVDYVNQKWSEYTGLPSEASMNLGVFAAIHPDDHHATSVMWRESLREGKPLELQFRLRSKVGEYRWFIVRALPLLDRRGQALRWFGSCTDIHEQKKTSEELRLAKEAAERADQMKSSFLANMSHEIRTPLGAILGFTELLADPSLDDGERLEFLRIVARNGQSLSRIVDDILDLSKVEAGLLTLERVQFQLEPLLSETVALFQELARGKGLWLKCRTLPGRRTILVSDPIRIRQMVSNLVSNALKFTEDGGVEIELKTRGEAVEILVRDTGIGIPPQLVNRLFQPFTQAEASTHRRFGGTGLGLHLSRKLAEALGGDLSIASSQPGRGSVFVLRLPLGAPLETAAANGSENRPENRFEMRSSETVRLQANAAGLVRADLCLQGRRILIIDDSSDNILLVERLLTKFGADVECAIDGFSGVEKALNSGFDLIFMDLQMPNLDGFEATRRLRASQLETPIIALTAHVVEDVRERSAQAGCNGFLSKPVHAPDLIRMSLEALENPQQMRVN